MRFTKDSIKLGIELNSTDIKKTLKLAVKPSYYYNFTNIFMYAYVL